METSTLLPSGLAQIAREELGETDEIRDQSLKALRQLIREKGLDRAPIDDDAYVLRFLRTSKFNVRKAFDRVVNYMDVREKYADDYAKATVHVMEPLVRCGCYNIFPANNRAGSQILYASAQNYDPKKISSEQIYLSAIFGLEVFLTYPEFQIPRHVMLLNGSGFSLSHIIQWTPRMVKRTVTVGFRANPMRIGAVHVVNEAWIVKKLYALVYPFLSEKIRKRFYFHGSDLKSLHSVIDPSVLPPELGGSAEIVSPDALMNKYFPSDLSND